MWRAYLNAGKPPMSLAEPVPFAPSRPVNSRSPFVRLTELIGHIEPGKPPISLAVGEPQHPIPRFVGPVLQASLADFGRYPGNKGTPAFCGAAAQWLDHRYRLPRPVDPLREVLVLCGTREGLFLAALAAKRFVKPRAGKPAILIPNPFYAVYSAGAVAADCEPVYLSAHAETGFLPDLDRLDEALLARTVAMYLASPSNPQGAVASLDYMKRAGGARPPPRLHAVLRRVLLGNLLARSARRHAAGSRRRLFQRRRFSLAIEAFEPAGPACRLRRGRSRFHAGSISTCAPWPRPQVPDAGAGGRHRRL